MATNTDESFKHTLTPSHFYGLSCAYCSNESTNLKSCKQCRRAHYCNSDCQRQHWKIHKPTCMFLKDVMNLVRDKPITSSKDRYTNLNYAMRVLNAGEEKILGGLWFMNDRTCSICYKSPFHFQNKTKDDWFNCLECNFGWCCSESHWDMYKSKHTQDICQRYQESTQDQMYIRRHRIEYKEEFIFSPSSVCSDIMQSFPTSWEEYYELRSPLEYSSRNLLPRSFFPCSTRLGSQICTLVYGVEQMGLLPTFNTKQNMQLHVIGAASGFEWPPTCIWEEILHIFPNLVELDVCFIGPDVKIADVGTNTGGEMGELDTCPDCEAKKRVRKYSFYRGTYHDYKTSQWFKTPDVCVAFNRGLHEDHVESWEDSLQVLIQMKVPCIFTSYDDQEAQKDALVFKKLKANFVMEPRLNPFRCLNYMVDQEDIDKFYQINAYITCFRGLSRSGTQA